MKIAARADIFDLRLLCVCASSLYKLATSSPLQPNKDVSLVAIAKRFILG